MTAFIQSVSKKGRVKSNLDLQWVLPPKKEIILFLQLRKKSALGKQMLSCLFCCTAGINGSQLNIYIKGRVKKNEKNLWKIL